MASKHPELAGALIARCFHARTVAHILHLKAKTFATHLILDEFYKGIIEPTDRFAEAYQGDYGVIESYPTAFRMFSDGLSLLDDLDKWITDNRHDVCDEDDTYLQALIDEIVIFTRQSTYKLRFLK